MIRTKTELLARINAVDKMLKYCGITKESVGEAKYSSLFRGLHSEDSRVNEAAFKDLASLYATLPESG